MRKLTAMKSAQQLPDTPYVYEPLDPDAQQIRLIHVNRNECGTIHCDLITFDFRDIPDYVCLSYTWGSPSSPQRIAVNDGHLDVRENLHNFLEEYCHQPHEYIWIDQISIDQSNIHERGHQVGMMAKIFKQAVYVIVWLGNDDRYLQAAMNLNATTGVTDSIKMTSGKVLIEDVYFSRLWIVQEILLAAEVWLLVKGSVWVLWDTLKVWHYGTSVVQIATLNLLSIGGVHAQSYSFAKYIAVFSHNKCQNALDKVYGLLGLAGSDIQIVPDYTVSVEDCYIKTIRALYLAYWSKRNIKEVGLVQAAAVLAVGLQLRPLHNGIMRCSTVDKKVLDMEVVLWKLFGRIQFLPFEGHLEDVGFEFAPVGVQQEKSDADVISTYIASLDVPVPRNSLSLTRGRWWFDIGGQRIYC